jgi:predicted DNA repair protein MutK
LARSCARATIRSRCGRPAADRITVAVYGSVALVKANDAGAGLRDEQGSGFTRSTGRAIVLGMPYFLTGLTIVGTPAMIWVGVWWLSPNR